eukprot:GHVL01005803.1.p2 GENE.GHVL01005803.1~~GHVL01005803.1.p2  ORF type:complete len:332 (+),score=93.30 GHVL01005803.1:1090-2085(+)
MKYFLQESYPWGGAAPPAVGGGPQNWMVEPPSQPSSFFPQRNSSPQGEPPPVLAPPGAPTPPPGGENFSETVIPDILLSSNNQLYDNKKNNNVTNVSLDRCKTDVIPYKLKRDEIEKRRVICCDQGVQATLDFEPPPHPTSHPSPNKNYINYPSLPLTSILETYRESPETVGEWNNCLLDCDHLLKGKLPDWDSSNQEDDSFQKLLGYKDESAILREDSSARKLLSAFGKLEIISQNDCQLSGIHRNAVPLIEALQVRDQDVLQYVLSLSDALCKIDSSLRQSLALLGFTPILLQCIHPHQPRNIRVVACKILAEQCGSGDFLLQTFITEV